MTLATELNPHETELNPHEAVPGAASRAGADQKWRLSAHGAELTSTQPTGAGPAVTPPAIRGTRDAPPPPLAELAHAYPPICRQVRSISRVSFGRTRMADMGAVRGACI